MKIHTLIPSRMGSTRLPGKALKDIGGKPLVVRVWQQAQKAGVGPVTVACGDEEIAEAVRQHGGEAVVTERELPRGVDRIWQALQTLIAAGADKPDIIMNVQGDEPLFPPELIHEAVKAFELGWPDIVTFCHETDDPEIVDSPDCVKVATNEEDRALYFCRYPIPYRASSVKHHIGFYAYRYETLERFVNTPPTMLEELEDLEQLRGLELDMRYWCGTTDHTAMGVDTADDLEKVRQRAVTFFTDD